MVEPEAAVALVHARGLEESILLIRRSEREGDPWSGHWSLPGGRREPEDYDLLHTALRELEEECGIRLGRAQMEAAFPPAPARRRTGPLVLVAPFLFCLDRELPAVPDAREAVEAVWVPLRVLRDPARHALRRVPGLPAELLFPAIDLGGVPLWGFTYRLLTQWLGLDPHDREQAGFEVACLVLDFLLSRGLTLKQGWVDRSAPEAAKVAEVHGVIPAAQVVAEFSVAGRHVLGVNRLEVRQEYVRLTGPAFEEYVIHASGEGRPTSSGTGSGSWPRPSPSS